jgi:hypothetical protein
MDGSNSALSRVEMSHPDFSKAGVMNFVQMSRSLSWRLFKSFSLLQLTLFSPHCSLASRLI